MNFGNSLLMMSPPLEANLDCFAMIDEAKGRWRALPPLTTANFRGSTMAIPTQARARAYFNYDHATGNLTFNERPRGEFRSEAAYARHIKRIGGKAGSVNSQGYVKVYIDGHYYPAHHVIWLLVTGEWVDYPQFEIDHINGKRADNRWDNLRKGTKSDNQRNGGQRKNNTSGIHGVNWKPRPNGKSGGWVARIWNGPRHVYLGFFRDIEHAAIARRAAERALGFTGSDRPAGRYIDRGNPCVKRDDTR